MWRDTEEQWKMAFNQAWLSYRNGSLPIGAVISNEDGNIISMGRNKINEKLSLNPKIAHAEIECLSKLDVTTYPNVKKYILYTTMEPCPMCMGTIVMSNIRKVRIAAKDSYCGATYYCESDSYIKSKKIDVQFILGELQIVQLVMQSSSELQHNNGNPNSIVALFEQTSPQAVKIAMDFYEEGYLERCIADEIDFGVIHDNILSRL